MMRKSHLIGAGVTLFSFRYCYTFPALFVLPVSLSPIGGKKSAVPSSRGRVLSFLVFLARPFFLLSFPRRQRWERILWRPEPSSYLAGCKANAPVSSLAQSPGPNT